MNRVVQLLTELGPSLTSDIASAIQKAGSSPAAARQRVSRLPEEVRTLQGLPFPKKARFLYLQKQFGSPQYWRALASAIDKANPAYSAALAGLRARGGYAPSRHFDIISGSPVKQKGQLSGATILGRLCSVGLLAKFDINGIGECVMLAEEGIAEPTSLVNLHARISTENFLLDAIRTWAGKMNLVSPKTARIRDEEPAPQFATCKFDLCGPSYLRPVVRMVDEKFSPGFLVADVVLGRGLNETEVEPFLRKCVFLGHLRGVRPFLPMLIADGFTKEALRACRSRGIIATRPETLFGQDVARGLSDLLKTLSNAAAVAATDPGKIEALFTRLGAIEGSAGNLRGALFEMVVGHMVRSIEGGSIDIGALMRSPETGQRAEIDVRLVKERNLVLYECKGYQPSSLVGEREITDWLENRIPIINAAHRAEERFSDSSIRFEFWTCGGFHEDALRKLQNARYKLRKYEIAWKSGTEIREYAKQIKAPGIRKILDDYYFNHPLSKIPHADDEPDALAVPSDPPIAQILDYASLLSN